MLTGRGNQPKQNAKMQNFHSIVQPDGISMVTRAVSEAGLSPAAATEQTTGDSHLSAGTLVGVACLSPFSGSL